MAEIFTATPWAPTLEGIPGKSAYEIAAEEGFLGSEEQWLASLVGPTGATGATGPQGEQGEAGTNGIIDSIVAGDNITVDNTDPANPIISAVGGGGGGAWTLVDSWVYASDVPSVIFDNIPAYSELLISCEGVSLSVSGVRRLVVSDNNGATFYNTAGDYNQLTTAGALSPLAIINFHATSATGARTGLLRFLNFNLASVIRHVLGSGETTYRLISASIGQIDAVKIDGSAGGNLTGGAIYIYGR